MIRERLLELISLEIGFHQEITNPWYWRVLCKIFRKRECHRVVVGELEYIKGFIEREKVRICADCGKTYSPADSMQWWCVPCLLKRYNDLREFGIDYSKILKDEPELTTNAPGGS